LEEFGQMPKQEVRFKLADHGTEEDDEYANENYEDDSTPDAKGSKKTLVKPDNRHPNEVSN